jgi:hypothetical protein
MNAPSRSTPEQKVFDADDGDRWRRAREDLRAKCCGEVDSSGTCFAPACRQGEALKAMDEMFDHMSRIEAELKRVDGYDKHLTSELENADLAARTLAALLDRNITYNEGNALLPFDSHDQAINHIAEARSTASRAKRGPQ